MYTENTYTAGKNLVISYDVSGSIPGYILYGSKRDEGKKIDETEGGCVEPVAN